MSKKRLKKIERNQKYVEQRKQLLRTANGEVDIDMDSEAAQKAKKPVKEPTQLDQVKGALWAAVEDTSASGLGLQLSGQGTTLGVQAF